MKNSDINSGISKLLREREKKEGGKEGGGTDLYSLPTYVSVSRQTRSSKYAN